MNNFQITNCDTDSISFRKPDGAPFTEQERADILKKINEISPEMILWEDDGYYPVFIVLKSKNYLMVDEKGNRKIKGSAFKSSTMEPILKEMISEVMDMLINEDFEGVKTIYTKYLEKAEHITDIAPWCSKKTLSPTTYNSTRKNEQDIINAIKNTEYKSGDRVYLYTTTKEIETGEYYKVGVKKGQPKLKTVKVLKLRELYANDHSVEHYKGRVKKALERFEPILGKDFLK